MENTFNAFAFNIFRLLSENNNENTLISPFGILTALNVYLFGADCETSKELFEALKYDLNFSSPEEVHDFMQKIIKSWSEENNSFSLHLANCLLVKKESDCEVDKDFKRNVNEIYKAIVKEVDFATEQESIIEACNEWVCDATNKMVPLIIDQIPASTKSALLNAVYFKGEWQTEFHTSLTENQPFFNFGDKNKGTNIPMMFKEELGCRVYSVTVEGEELRMLELPYKENMTINLMLTKSVDGLHKILSKIDISILEDMELLSHKADLWLPKFRLESNYELKDALNALGIRDAFTESAKFPGIAKQNLCISSITHKAVFEVDERGTEIPEASAIEMIISCSMPLPITQFRIDHPFAFYVKDISNGVILLVGKILTL